MGQVSTTRRYRFCAAHRLHTEQLSEEENRVVFGKCNNANGHGHNYVVMVTVKDPTSTAKVDLAELDRIVTDTIVTRWDHQDLNLDPEFANVTTTGENLVKLIWKLLVTKLPDGQLEKVGLIETRDNYFEYAGTGERRGGSHA